MQIDNLAPQSNSQEYNSVENTANYLDKLTITDSEKPKILLIGLRRSGKTSIRKVVFDKAAPNETIFLESTQKIETTDISSCSFIKFDLMDLPGQGTYTKSILNQPEIYNSSCALIFVIDAQDDYIEALNLLNETVTNAYKINSSLKFEVFIHKVDCLSEDLKIDVQSDITQRVTAVNEELLYDNETLGVGGPNQGISIGFHLTTIYDHSIFEAFSKVVQKLIPNLESFENLLNIFVSNSLLDKVFLFDVTSKIYLATDSVSFDMLTYELCCDMLDVVVDISSIYFRTPHPKPFSDQISTMTTLNNDTVLYLRGVNQYMALVCLMREEALEKTGIIEYNFQVVKNSLQKMLELNEKTIQRRTFQIMDDLQKKQLEDNVKLQMKNAS